MAENHYNVTHSLLFIMRLIDRKLCSVTHFLLVMGSGMRLHGGNYCNVTYKLFCVSWNEM